jgi:hypothetical protein
MTQCSILRRRPADAFLYQADNKTTEPIPLILPDFPEVVNHPLISIGPYSDTVLDRFELGDMLLPKLHSLVRTVRSSRWEATLRSSPWNLTYEKASNLTQALVEILIYGLILFTSFQTVRGSRSSL